MLHWTRLTPLVAMIAILFCTVTHAQQTQPTTQLASEPTTTPTTAPTEFTLNFKDVPIDAVLDYFSQTLGFEILRDGPIDARVTIMSKQPVSADEAMTMLSAALRVNGFAIIHQGRMLQIGARDKARKQNVPVHFGNNPDDVPDTDEMITQVIPIQNVNAKKLADDLKPLVEQDALTANEGSNSIIVTDTAANVRRLVKIIASLDDHEATTAQLHVIQLRHATATVVAKLIDTLFKTGGGQSQPQQNGGMMRGGPPQQQGQPEPGAEGGSERHGQSVVVTADDRTNKLLIMASAGTLKMIDDLVDQLDTDNPNPAPPSYLRIFPLKFAAADATAKLINDLFKPANNNNSILQLIYGEPGPSSDEDKKVPVNATSDERTNTVLVTGPPERLKDVEALIERLDTSPMVSQDLRVFRLQYADAYDVARLITEMFLPKKDEDTGNSRFGIIFLSPVPPDQQVRGLKITVSSDERTNTLLVSAPTAVLDSIEKVVRQLDSNPATEDTVFIYHLRNGQAQHLGYTLNVLFGNIANNNNQNNQQNGQFPQFNPNGQNGFGQNQQNSRPPENNTPDTGNRPANNRNSQNNRQGLQGVSSALSPSVNELTGKVFIVPEPDTNALLVTTASKYEPVVKKIIEDLDQPVRQVLIKVLVAEVTHDNGDQFGVDFSVLNERQTSNHPELTGSTVVTSPITTSTTSGPGGTTSSTSGGSTVTNTYSSSTITNGSALGTGLGAAAAAAASPSGLVYSLLEHNVTATIEALQTEGKLDVLSRPYILTSDNQEATIVIGEEDPFVSDTRVETTGQLVNTIQYQQIGVILDVTPHVNPNGLVVMDVNPQVSEKEPGGVTITQGVISPIYSTRTATAHVAIPDGSTIVIGGMMQDQVTSQVNKVPILGDLPLVGVLFQNTAQQKTKTELLFFLTPHVAQMPENLQAMSNDEQKGTQLTPTAVGPGVFDEHMKGMQRGESPQTQPTQPSSPIMSIPLN